MSVQHQTVFLSFGKVLIDQVPQTYIMWHTAVLYVRAVSFMCALPDPAAFLMLL
jgi:hypothetical protein